MNLLICSIIFNSAWLGVNIETRLIVADSEAQCYSYAAHLSNGVVSVTWGPGDDKRWDRTPESYCGPQLRDCEDIRRKP